MLSRPTGQYWTLKTESLKTGPSVCEGGKCLTAVGAAGLADADDKTAVGAGGGLGSSQGRAACGAGCLPHGIPNAAIQADDALEALGKLVAGARCTRYAADRIPHAL